MSILAVGIGFCLMCTVAFVWFHHRQARHLQLATPELTIDSTRNTDTAVAVNRTVPTAVSVVLIVLPLVIYSQLGRFTEWDKGVVDEHIDYLIAADINKNARKAYEQPNNEIALLNLAQSYTEGGLYAKAVETLDKVLALSGDDPKTLGLKASAMYYRDNRTMSIETSVILARALALDEFDFQSLLLIATDAYLNKDYEKAIAHWQILLRSPSQSFNRAAINNAILKTEQKIANRSVTASE
ncbi:tetratricopeptide repeat protein [Shewanella youngdeokensis]|uniref:Tetratricopeptide repeat protein n=1 Tax=Shewanella youngdeokensis TaxID=2999068 RepID=A0ABZ0JYY5_9GAMM|nr:tetratricopeptide repeat protein [Shewanella sp. DAU334]